LRSLPPATRGGEGWWAADEYRIVQRKHLGHSTALFFLLLTLCLLLVLLCILLGCSGLGAAVLLAREERVLVVELVAVHLARALELVEELRRVLLLRHKQVAAALGLALLLDLVKGQDGLLRLRLGGRGSCVLARCRGGRVSRRRSAVVSGSGVGGRALLGDVGIGAPVASSAALLADLLAATRA
jgi:hypothetical protein